MNNFNSRSPVPKSRSTNVWVILLLSVEILCGLFLINSLRNVFLPTWSESKLASLQTELANTRQSDAPTPAIAVIDQTATSTPEPTATQPPTATATVPPTATALPTATAEDQSPLSAEAKMALKTVFAMLPTSANRKDQPDATSELVDLGRILYFDPRLSVSETVSCNKCHDLENYGVDNLARSVGVAGSPVDRNSPTVFNAAIHVAQFWDGRSPDVEDQATKPIMAAGEMGMIDESNLKAKIMAIPGYQKLFGDAFPDESDPVNLTNMGIAIGAFERGLLTPSRFDKYLAGDQTQLNEQELRGLNTFVSLRCVTCHLGAGIGGSLYKRLGQIEPYQTEDLGRYVITKEDNDKYVFKVPSLRNVAKTAPYLHDGSIATLEEMVPLMARYQLGKTVTTEEVNDVVAFLNTLTGEIPSDYIQAPELPQ